MPALLNWHLQTRNRIWRAWATALFPADSMPPSYRLVKVRPGQTARKVLLNRPSAPNEDYAVVEIGVGIDLATAKGIALRHYNAALARPAMLDYRKENAR